MTSHGWEERGAGGRRGERGEAGCEMGWICYMLCYMLCCSMLCVAVGVGCVHLSCDAMLDLVMSCDVLWLAPCHISCHQSVSDSSRSSIVKTSKKRSWFSQQSALEVYATYLALDTNQNGM